MLQGFVVGTGSRKTSYYASVAGDFDAKTPPSTPLFACRPLYCPLCADRRVGTYLSFCSDSPLSLTAKPERNPQPPYFKLSRNEALFASYS